MNARSLPSPSGWELDHALSAPWARLPRLRFLNDPPGGDPAGGANNDPGSDPDDGSSDPAGGDGDDLTEGGLKALKSERAARKAADARVRELEAQLADKSKGGGAKPKPKIPEPKAELGDPAELSTDDRIAALEKQLADEAAARAAAEASALRTRLAAAAKLPEPVAALLTGSTEDEITAQIEQIAPHVITHRGGGVLPNPQQGQPSKARASAAAEGDAEADRRFGTKKT